MLVVSDTTPLNYLLLIDAIDILPARYSPVVVPAQVVKELRHPGAPPTVRAWANDLPDWIEVRQADESRFPTLDAGEAAALALALDLRAPLLADEAPARALVRTVDVPTIGTVGLIVEAHLDGRLDFEDAVSRLRATNFRIGSEVIETLRRRITEEGRKTS